MLFKVRKKNGQRAFLYEKTDFTILPTAKDNAVACFEKKICFEEKKMFASFLWTLIVMKVFYDARYLVPSPLRLLYILWLVEFNSLIYPAMCFLRLYAKVI